MNYTLPFAINLINIIIIVDLAYNYFYRFRNAVTIDQIRTKNLTCKLLIANTFAFILGMLRILLYGYGNVPFDILLVSFSDRYVMMYAYFDLKGFFK